MCELLNLRFTKITLILISQAWLLRGSFTLTCNIIHSQILRSSKCKMVYITRNPKDTLVSMWYFFNTRWKSEQGPYPFDNAFEAFCKGTFHGGPFFEHVLQYWKEHLKRPEKIMFLKYEDLKSDPKEQVKKLASFLGRPFAKEEEVDEVLRRCDFQRLKNLEVNKNGVDPWVNMPNSSVFRRGVTGDWKNHLTPEMADKLDEIVHSSQEVLLEIGRIISPRRWLSNLMKLHA